LGVKVPLELVEVGTSVGIGIVDNVLVELEERGKITGKLTYVKDGIRIVGALGGLITNAFVARPGTMFDRVSGALTLSTFPLAMHSIRRIVKSQLMGGAGYTLEQVGRQIVQQTQPMGSQAVITSY
jgi:hypothetical protein